MDRKARKHEEPNEEREEINIEITHGYLKLPAITLDTKFLSIRKCDTVNTIAYSKNIASEAAKLQTRNFIALCLSDAACFM